MKRSAAFILTFVGVCTLIAFAIRVAFPEEIKSNSSPHVAGAVTGTLAVTNMIKYLPVTAITFGPGRLDWKTGKLVFTGNAKRSARVFFERLIKPEVDAYIRDQMLDPKALYPCVQTAAGCYARCQDPHVGSFCIDDETVKPERAL